MFKESIMQTPFVGDIQDSVFSRIYGDSFRGEVSFISTLRALVFPRMSETDQLKVFYRECTLQKRYVDRNHPDAALSNAVGTYGTTQKNSVRIINVCGYMKEDNKAVLDTAENSFLRYAGGGFQRIEKFTEFFKKAFRTLCFVNKDDRITIVFVDEMDTRRFHFLQLAIPVMFPWYFPPESGLSDQELGIIQSLKEKEPDKYLAALQVAASKYDFRTMKIKSVLGNFEKRFLDGYLTQSREKLNAYSQDVKNYEDAIANLMAKYYEESIRMEGIQAKIANGGVSSELMNYFMRNKNLSIISSGSTGITFSVKSYLTYFDEDAVKRYLEKSESVLYSGGGNFSDGEIKMLMQAIFVDQILKMKFCASYSLDLCGSVQARAHERYGAEFSDCTPNPHIDRYHCLGDYRRYITDRLFAQDYIGAIEQCVVSCASLNFSDTTVIEEFMDRIRGMSNDDVNIRCIELPDGKTVNPYDAIEWLKEQQSRTEEAKNG